MRQPSLGETAWQSRIPKDPYNKIVEGIITSVTTSTGYAGVRLVQYGGTPIQCRISFQHVGVFCNARVMPCVGDVVLVGFGSEKRAELVAYVCPSQATITATGKDRTDEKEEEGRGGYYQLIKAARDGEEWTIRPPDEGKGREAEKRKIVFREIFPGEFTQRSGSPDSVGGAEVYGARDGTLHLLGGPTNLIKLIFRINEIQQYTDLFRRTDGASGAGSQAIEERLGTVKRKVVSGDSNVLASVVPLDDEIAIPQGGLSTDASSMATAASGVATGDSAKEYFLRIKRKIGFGKASKHSSMIEIKLGDVIDNRGMTELMPSWGGLTGTTINPVRAKLSVYDENSAGKNATMFKVDSSGNVAIKLMPTTDISGLDEDSLGTGGKPKVAKAFTIIGRFAKFLQVWKNIEIMTWEGKKQKITTFYTLGIGGKMSTVALEMKFQSGKDIDFIATKKFKVKASTGVDLISMGSIRIGQGNYQLLVNETFLTQIYNLHTHGGVKDGPNTSGPPLIPGITTVHTTLQTEAS